jgi:hypothetical protein
MDYKKLVKEINACYGEPFLPKGFVEATFTERGTLSLKIGDRDGDFEKDGELNGCGTNVGKAVEWQIKMKKNAR